MKLFIRFIYFSTFYTTVNSYCFMWMIYRFVNFNMCFFFHMKWFKMIQCNFCIWFIFAFDLFLHMNHFVDFIECIFLYFLHSVYVNLIYLFCFFFKYLFSHAVVRYICSSHMSALDMWVLSIFSLDRWNGRAGGVPCSVAMTSHSARSERTRPWGGKGGRCVGNERTALWRLTSDSSEASCYWFVIHRNKPEPTAQRRRIYSTLVFALPWELIIKIL